MEKELLNLILRTFTYNKYKEMYKDKITDFDLHINLDENITFDVIVDFNKKYFQKYKKLLLKNALIYALDKKQKEYLKHLESNLHNEPLNNNYLFQALTTKYAYHNLYNKYFNQINNDSKIIKKYSTIINKYLNTNIDNINHLYTKILLDYLNNYSIEDGEIIIDTLLNTTNLDQNFIEHNNTLLNKTTLNFYKKMISRIILGDNYLELKNMYTNEKYETINDFDETELNDDDYFDLINKTILNYIENCLEENNYSLPSDETIRLEMYSNFIDYNTYIKNHTKDFISLDKENIKKLTKINPTSILNIIYKN